MDEIAWFIAIFVILVSKFHPFLFQTELYLVQHFLNMGVSTEYLNWRL